MTCSMNRNQFEFVLSTFGNFIFSVFVCFLWWRFAYPQCLFPGVMEHTRQSAFVGLLPLPPTSLPALNIFSYQSFSLCMSHFSQSLVTWTAYAPVLVVWQVFLGFIFILNFFPIVFIITFTGSSKCDFNFLIPGHHWFRWFCHTLIAPPFTQSCRWLQNRNAIAREANLLLCFPQNHCPHSCAWTLSDSLSGLRLRTGFGEGDRMLTLRWVLDITLADSHMVHFGLFSPFQKLATTRGLSQISTNSVYKI